MARKLRRIERVEFSGDDYTLITAHMARLVDAGDGWINLIPKIADDREAPTSLGFLTLVGGGASGVTMCTWIPASHEHRGRSQASVGIAHVTGRRAVPELTYLCRSNSGDLARRTGPSSSWTCRPISWR